MDFLAFETKIKDAMKKYQKAARNYGVKDDEWIILKLTSTEIDIAINSLNDSKPAITLRLTEDKKKPIKVMYYDKTESFELSCNECIGFPKNPITALNRTADWIISNAL